MKEYAVPPLVKLTDGRIDVEIVDAAEVVSVRAPPPAPLRVFSTPVIVPVTVTAVVPLPVTMAPAAAVACSVPDDVETVATTLDHPTDEGSVTAKVVPIGTATPGVATRVAGDAMPG